MAESHIILSIVIVSYNTCRLLTDCLRSLNAVARLGAGDVEVIVVDNGSSDDTLPLLRKNFPWVRLIQNDQNTGFACANNQGIAQARGQYVLLLNSDTAILPEQPDALTRMVDFIAAHPRVGVVGAGLLNADRTPQLSWASFPSLLSELLGKNFRKRQPYTHEQAYQTDWVSGACLLARAEAIHDVGGLDERYFMYSEEVDWCFRMKQRGWQVVLLEDAQVVHLGGGSADRASFEQMRLLYGSKIRFFEKHYGPTQARSLRYGLAFVNSLGIAWRWLKHLFSFKPSSKPADANQTVSYQADSYRADSYRADSYRADSYRADSYRADSYRADSYRSRLAAQQQVIVWLLGN